MMLPPLSQRIEELVRKAMEQEELIVHRKAFGVTPLPQLLKDVDEIVGRTVRSIMREIEKGPGGR